MRRVAYLLGGLERGGTETLLLDTLKQSENQNIYCIVIHRKKGVLLSELTKMRAPIFYNPIHRLFYVRYIVRLRMLIKQHNIEIVHAHLPYDAFLAYWACIGTQVRLVMSIHGYDFDYKFLARRLMSFIIRRTSLNLFVSHHLKKHYIDSYRLINTTKQKVLYNGIDFEKFNQVKDKTLRQYLSILPNTLLLGSVGNFVNGRDQLTICHFLKELKLYWPDFLFVFIGSRNNSSPNLYDNCVAYCRENGLLSNVCFLGQRNDVPVLLRELDAFLYASDHDTFGIAVVEAIAVSLPVFVNDWGVMQEITENGRLATLYKSKDIKDLLAHFREFLENRDSFQKQAAISALIVRERYSIQKHSKALQQIYKSVLHATSY